VVEFVGETLVNRSVALNVDDVPKSKSGQIRGHMNGSMTSEGSLEKSSGLSSLSFAVRHYIFC